MEMPLPSQLLPGILDLREARISVFPEGEEFLIMLFGLVFLLIEKLLTLLLLQHLFLSN